jgi:hypothetical protein
MDCHQQPSTSPADAFYLAIQLSILSSDSSVCFAIELGVGPGTDVPAAARDVADPARPGIGSR